MKAVCIDTLTARSLAQNWLEGSASSSIHSKHSIHRTLEMSRVGLIFTDVATRSVLTMVMITNEALKDS